MSVLKIRDENGNVVEIPAFKGKQGQSAYEVAVENGYEGTVEEWLESLKSGGASAEQTFNPTSQNAQSGKAVAQALENKQDKFALVEDSGNRKDITFTEDVKITGDTVYLEGMSTIYLPPTLYLGDMRIQDGRIEGDGYDIGLSSSAITGIPTPDGTNTTAAVNVEYINNVVGNIETLLGGI